MAGPEVDASAVSPGGSCRDGGLGPGVRTFGKDGGVKRKQTGGPIVS